MEEEDGGIPLKHITCAVCLEVYTSPYALPCLHSYCKGCLRQLLGKKSPGHISCPECRKLHQIQNGDISSLQPNFLLVNLIDQYKVNRSKKAAKVKTPRSVSPEEDLPPPLCLTPTRPKPNLVCSVHNQVVKVYCRTCDQVLCDACLPACEHEGRQDVRKAVEDQQSRLSDLLGRASRHEGKLSTELPSKRELEEVVVASKNTVATQVNESFSLVQSIIESRRHYFLQLLEERMATQEALLVREAQLMETKINTIHRHCNAVSACLESAKNEGNQLEVLSMNKDILADMESLLKTPSFSDLMSAALDSVKFSLRDEHIAKLKDQVECAGHLSSGVHPPHCHIQGLPVTQQLNSGEHCQLQLICMNGSQQPCQEIESIRSQVSVKLISRSSDVAVSGNIHRGSGNVLFITLVAPTPGAYTIHTTINSQHVANSPLDLLVQPSVSPSRPVAYSVPEPDVTLPKFVRKITDGAEKSRFSDIAVTKSGTIVATDLAGDRVCVFSSDGKKQISFGSRGKNDGNFNEPRCVAVDSSEDIYVADYNNHRVQKFSIKKGGRHLLCFGPPKQGDALRFPSGIAVGMDNTIYITEQFSCRILTYNTNGHNIRCFAMPQGDGPRQMKFASYISISPTKSLYVSDKQLQSVHVISSDGSYQRRLVDEGKTLAKMRRPLGIAVNPTSEDVYVAEADGHCVAVVTKYGSVHHFGTKGSSDSEFNNPQGIFFHAEQEMLYIADQQNKRIVVYKCS